MKSRRVRRSSYRRNNHFLAVIVLLLVLGAVSYGGASLWQYIDDKNDPESEGGLVLSAQEEPREDDPNGEETPNREEDPSEEEPSSQESSLADSTVSPLEGLDSVVVPKGDWVDSEYFDDAMFVGDSITYGMKVYNTMTNATIIAHTGINPQTILNKAVIQEEGETLTVLEAMARHDPGKIYVMMGANGVAFLDEDVMMGFYSDFLDEIMAQHPDATLYVQSILPVTAEKSEDERYSNDRIDQYNVSLMNLCKEKGIHYLNVAEAFKDEEGNLPTEASPKDGMHFGSTYYMKWFDYLKCHAVEE